MMKYTTIITLSIICLLLGGLVGRFTVLSLRGQDFFIMPDMRFLVGGGITDTGAQANTLLSYDEKIFLAMSGAHLSSGLHTDLRRVLISKMIQHGYHDFFRTPYSVGNGLILLNTAGTGYTFSRVITGEDSLDRLIAHQLNQYTTLTRRQEHVLGMSGGIRFGTEVVMSLTGVMLFRTREDLDALGYEVISWRRRQSFDTGVRRYNIQKAFDNFGGVRVLNTSGVLSFFAAIQYDPQTQKQFKFGKGIVGSDIIEMYAGGICGASTALLQGTLMNSGIVYNQLRNHTKWYTNLYSATINGDIISTPGLDATVYDGTIDFKISNNAGYPIIIVANFGGQRGDVEEVFTLGHLEDKGTLIFATKKGNCLTRQRNTEIIKSCYREIDPKHEEVKPVSSSVGSGDMDTISSVVDSGAIR